MGDNTRVTALLDDMRCDREELVVLRKFYDDVFAITKKPPQEQHDLMLALLDALPKRREYMQLRETQRRVILSPTVDGFW